MRSFVISNKRHDSRRRHAYVSYAVDSVEVLYIAPARLL